MQKRIGTRDEEKIKNKQGAAWQSGKQESKDSLSQVASLVIQQKLQIQNMRYYLIHRQSLNILLHEYNPKYLATSATKRKMSSEMERLQRTHYTMESGS